MRYTLICLAIAGVVILSTPGQDVPELMNYQGLLTDEAGVPLTTGTYDILFSLYADADGATRVWGPEIHADAQVIDGQFNVILGSIEPLGDAFENPERYLGVSISPEEEITPRQRILSAPYALSAQNGVPAGVIMPYAGAGLPPGGWLLCDGSAVDRSQYTALFAAIGVTWGAGDGSTTFNLPDLMSDGRFLRGGTPGTMQGDATAMPAGAPFQTAGGNDGRHVHYFRGYWNHGSDGEIARAHDWLPGDPITAATVPNNVNDWNNPAYNGSHGHAITGGDEETRPVNAAVNWIIKH